MISKKKHDNTKTQLKIKLIYDEFYINSHQSTVKNKLKASI